MSIKSLSPLLLAVLLGTGLYGCDATDGPAEEAGEDVDNALERGGEKIERAGDKVEDATDR